LKRNKGTDGLITIAHQIWFPSFFDIEIMIYHDLDVFKIA